MTTLLKHFWHWLDPFFPTNKLPTRKIPPLVLAISFVILTVLFACIGWFIKPNGFVGFDWVNFFSVPRAPVFYPPWTVDVLRPLTWPVLIGITLASFTIATFQRSVHPLSAVASILCLPLIWTLFLGQLEGIALFGLLGMPWLVPLALIKPQVTVFAFLANRKYLLVLAVFLLLSLLVWGLWPLRTLAVESYYSEGRYPQNIGLGWWGLPLALISLWLSRGDMDLLMLSGSFALNHIIPYNLLPVVPAVARLRPRDAWIAMLLSWLPFAANWLGSIGWWLGWIFHLWLWVQLLRTTYPERIARIFVR